MDGLISWLAANAFVDAIVYDFEFQQEGGRHTDSATGRGGGRVLPLALVTRSLVTGRVDWYWRDRLRTMTRAPFDTGPRTLAVNWFASAEANCFTVLRWKLPERLLCMHAEFRWWQNGIASDKPPGLIDALRKFGVPSIGVAAKEASRETILTTSHWTEAGKQEVLTYCQSDVDGTSEVFLRMLPKLDLPRALLRGRYSAVCGVIEDNGIPLDAAWWQRFDRFREPLLQHLVKEVDRAGIYDGMVFKQARFRRLVAYLRIPWERTDSGRLRLEDEYFRDQATIYPILEHLHLLRQTLGKLRKPRLSIGPDGRNRVLLGPWGTITGRNAYSTNKSIFGPDRWTRFTIRPTEGSALAYVDWSAQEIGIAAFLAKDERLIETYLAVDPYLYFGGLSGLLPKGAVRGSDEVEMLRDKIKILFLGMGYGMTLHGLIWRLGGDRALAERMLRAHRDHYAAFWRWVGRSLDNADMRGRDWTMFGWQVRVVDNVHRPDLATRMNTLQNWPAQSHGAEMMRLAAIALVEAGIRVAFPVHDAFLVEGPARDIADITRRTRQIMERAGEAMFGVPFRAKSHVFTDRFEDDRPGAQAMWLRVDRLLCEREQELGSRQAVPAALAPEQSKAGAA